MLTFPLLHDLAKTSNKNLKLNKLSYLACWEIVKFIGSLPVYYSKYEYCYARTVHVNIDRESQRSDAS